MAITHESSDAFPLFHAIAHAQPSTASCDIAQERHVRAEELLRQRQETLLQARRQIRLADSHLVKFSPGAIFSTGRAHRCAQEQSTVSLQETTELNTEDQCGQTFTTERETRQFLELQRIPNDTPNPSTIDRIRNLVNFEKSMVIVSCGPPLQRFAHFPSPPLTNKPNPVCSQFIAHLGNPKYMMILNKLLIATDLSVPRG